MLKLPQSFLQKCHQAHNNKYDYSDTKFVSYSHKITIKCPEHGHFQQRPYDHSIGMGCSQCGFKKIGLKLRLSFNDFVEKANKLHNNKYTYSDQGWKPNKYIITCPNHGDFYQSRNLHLLGSGCPICANCKPLTYQDIVDRCNKTHNFRYSYLELIGKRIKIVCKEHGEFTQRYNDHIYGSNCKQCSKISSANLRKFSIEEIIDLAKKAHGDKYDYSQVHYINTATKIEIICPNHGLFEQLVQNHIRGNGCKQCKNFVSKGEVKWLDSLNILSQYRQYKIVINGKRILADGYNPLTNTVYEYDGDYWHGNPMIYDPKDINKNCKKTFGTLWQKTLEKRKLIKDGGYNLISIWESEFETV